MINVTLPDGAVREYEEGIKLYDVARDISEGLARNTLGAVVNGQTMGLQEKLTEDSKVEFVDFKDQEGRDVFRHTTAHVMALAVQRLFPGVKFAIGPAIEDGFYYDFDTDHRFVPEDLEKIENEMKKIIKENPEFERYEMSRDEALEYFEKEGEKYKIDLIENLDKDEVISFYKLGDFTDLCRGPHLYDLKKIKALKLTSIAGAYWRGDEKNDMLQRIYGTSFPKKKDLDEHMERIEEAQRRDHRKIGREMDLFMVDESAPGFPFFLPKGMILRNQVVDFWKDLHKKNNYGEITTPIILSRSLWETSGHWDHYRENMYTTKIDDEDYAIKPMNCPGGVLVYKNSMHSYRDLPIRNAELGLVHRHELSGTLHGLFRVRAFTQDDAHIYMSPDQIEEEIIGVIDLADEIYSTFGFEYELELSTRPENSMGSDEDWEHATESLRKALESKGKDYTVNEGDGAFYGPKIDFHLKDAIGRDWQCGTIQLDFQLPERFDMTYIDENGEKKRPVMVHRAILGSLERFMGILIEHYEGKFPAWMSPTQVRILPISDKFNDAAFEIKKIMEKKNIRVEVDSRSEKLGFKIREAQVDKVNYSLVLGAQEVEDGTVSVRKRDEGEIGTVKVEDFIKNLEQEIEDKK